MEKNLKRFRGIYPGLILARELKKRAIKPSPFALSLDTHKQVFNAIIKGKGGGEGKVKTALGDYISAPMTLQ